MAKVIGIDLGTTNSVVAVMDGKEPVVILNQEGKRTTPSVVGFKPDGERLVGEMAKRQAVINPLNTIYSIKRFMGKSYEEATEEAKAVNYKVVKNNNICGVEIDGKIYTPQEISSMILMKLKKAAEDYLGTEVKDAVITVPAYFNDAQRKATKEAGEIAGLNVLRIINEPTAAALAYGYEKEKEGKIVVFDLGGGTFDISILEVSDGVFEVLATSGDNHLGGDDFDAKIMEWIIQETLHTEGIDLRKDVRAMQRIREAAEQAKIELSSQQATEISLPYITVDPRKGPININLTLTRSKFEAMCEDLYERIKKPCYKAIEGAKINVSEIKDVILVGGSTRMPRVQQIAKEIFGIEPNKSVNPDEAVAIGAAIQGAVLSGEVKDILLLDVIPMTLGVEIHGGVMAKIIEANTTIPVRKTELFSTVADNQTTVEIHVLQGERVMAADNKSLGRFYLDGIPPAPRGIPQIEVTFDVDANGILKVTARDKGTGKEQSIRIEGSTNLSKEEIERMKREAKMYEEEDKRKREEVEKMNNIDNLVYQMNKMIRESGDKISEEDKQKINDKINELNKIKETKQWDKYDKAVSEAYQVIYAVSSALYSSASAETQGEASAVASTDTVSDNGKEEQAKTDNVKDVEYEEI